MISDFDPHRGHNSQVENCYLRGLLKMKLIEEWKGDTWCRLLEGRTQEQMWRGWDIPLLCKHGPTHSASRLMICSCAGEILIFPWEHRIALMCPSRNTIRGKIMSLEYRFCDQNLTKCSETINGCEHSGFVFSSIGTVFALTLYNCVVAWFQFFNWVLLSPMLKFCRYRR